LPDDLVYHVFLPKYLIENDLKIVARRRVTVEIERAAHFQDAVHFDQSDSHHGEIGHQVAGTHKLPEGLHHVFEFERIRAHHYLVECLLTFFAPEPGVFKGLNLRTGEFAGLVGENDIVGALRIEGRVEIDQVDGLILDVFAQDFEIVAVIECVHGNDNLIFYRESAINKQWIPAFAGMTAAEKRRQERFLTALFISLDGAFYLCWCRSN
jgi:hypothetical protein